MFKHMRMCGKGEVTFTLQEDRDIIGRYHYSPGRRSSDLPCGSNGDVVYTMIDLLLWVGAKGSEC